MPLFLIKKTKILILFVFTSVFSCFGQLKQIDYHAYDGWKKLEKQQVSANGLWISYEINPLKGDGYLYFYNQKTAKLDSIKRGKDASISLQEDVIAYTLTPGFDTLRTSELKKLRSTIRKSESSVDFSQLQVINTQIIQLVVVVMNPVILFICAL